MKSDPSMTTPDPMRSALDRAISIVGIGKLSETLGISRAAIYQWKKVPADRVLAVEAAVDRACADVERITREQLRPDLYPPS